MVAGMKIVRDKLTIDELKEMTKEFFDTFVKGVVDIDLGILALNAELHADLESKLLESGSKQENLWGINLYPDITGEGFVEFDSMINMRPSQGNMSRGVDNASISRKIIAIVEKRIAR